MMDVFEAHFMEKPGLDEGSGREENISLEKATFEPGALLEEKGDFKEAEILQASLETVFTNSLATEAGVPIPGMEKTTGGKDIVTCDGGSKNEILPLEGDVQVTRKFSWSEESKQEPPGTSAVEEYQIKYEGMPVSAEQAGEDTGILYSVTDTGTAMEIPRLTDGLGGSGEVGDPASILNTLLRESYTESTDDLAFIAAKIRFFNDAKQQIRELERELHTGAEGIEVKPPALDRLHGVEGSDGIKDDTPGPGEEDGEKGKPPD